MDKENIDVGYEKIIGYPMYVALKEEILVATRISISGITNFVTKYECPCLIDTFLKSCFKPEQIYNSKDVDFANMCNPNKTLMDLLADFIGRKEVLMGEFKDRTLILRNIDLCPEVYERNKGFTIPALAIFNRFRHPSVKMGCRILFVSDTELNFQFRTRTIHLPRVDMVVANSIFDNIKYLYESCGYKFNDSTNFMEGKIAIELISTPSFALAEDLLLEAFSASNESQLKNKKELDAKNICEKLKLCKNRYSIDKLVLI